jgi:hypothetical protein
MSRPTPCPSADDLEAFVLGRLAEPQAERLMEHLHHCPHCVESLHELRPADTLVDAMRAQAGWSAPPEEPPVRGLIDRLIRLPGPAPTLESLSITGEQTVTPPDAAADLTGCLTPPQAPDEIGRLGGYRILKVLGAGGMGVVFEAEDPRLNRRVALKAMLPTLATSPSARARFLREARAAAAIEHDHVVAVYQADEERGIPFLAMPLLRGCSLADRLRDAEPLPVAEALGIGRQIAAGLAAAHARGLVHRDVKPANVWLETLPGEPGGLSPRDKPGGSLRVKLLDFGLARAGDDQHLTATGAIAGTPAYMAPEQACGGDVGPRSDLFSLGCVLYRMVTGRQPFTGDTALAVLWSVTYEEPAPAADLVPGLPPEVVQLIGQLLAKDPAARPASAEVVARALAALEGQALPAQRAGDTLRLPEAVPAPARHGKSRRRLVGLAAGLLALLVGGLLAAQVVIRLKGKGRDTELTVPEGSRVEVDEGGRVTVTLPGAGLIKPDGPDLPRGSALGPAALVQRPAALAGVRSWTIERAGPAKAVTAVAWSPNGRLLAGCSQDRSLRIWDAATGRVVRLLFGQQSWLESVAFSPDGSYLAGAEEQGAVRLWDATCGTRSGAMPAASKPWPSRPTAGPSPRVATIAR